MAKLLMLGLIVALFSSAGAKPLAPPSVCITHPDTTAFPLEVVKTELTDDDSASVAALGLPYNPSSIKVENRNSVCSSVLAAYNALIPQADASHRITRAVVIRANTVYALFPAPTNAPGTMPFYFFSGNYRFITRLEALP